MNLHEYQAKELFRQYGISVPEGYPCDNVAEAIEAFKKLGGGKVVIKAQVHAGGRGKAGGVELVDSEEKITAFVERLEGTNLVTFQTDEHGQPVSKFLVEAASNIARELYLGAVVDRSTRRVVFMASTEGGMDIEEVAEATPEKILKCEIDPLTGAMPFQGRDLAFKLGLEGKQVNQFTKIFLGLSKFFHDCDLALIEINPLIVTAEGDVMAIDGKIGIDSNALYRLPKIKELHDPSQEDEREAHAASFELNYVALDGSIGCMVNGAGLAMGTMDIVALHGGFPANFLDVGGGATKERVAEAFKLILSDDKVKCVLVNIFGGIVRCDMIAEGIIGAVKEVGVEVPVVVRLEGTNADLGKKVLDDSDLDIIAATSLTDAAQQAVKASEGK